MHQVQCKLLVVVALSVETEANERSAIVKLNDLSGQHAGFARTSSAKRSS